MKVRWYHESPDFFTSCKICRVFFISRLKCAEKYGMLFLSVFRPRKKIKQNKKCGILSKLPPNERFARVKQHPNQELLLIPHLYIIREMHAFCKFFAFFPQVCWFALFCLWCRIIKALCILFWRHGAFSFPCKCVRIKNLSGRGDKETE